MKFFRQENVWFARFKMGGKPRLWANGSLRGLLTGLVRGYLAENLP